MKQLAMSCLLSTRTLASIVIVSHNSRAHLERCLRSLERTVDQACEIIVVDNGSADGSDRVVAERFSWVRLIRSGHNRGFAAATNLGASVSTGQYVVLLNPDTEVTPGWLDALLGPLQAEQRAPADGGPASAAGALPVGLTTARILLMDAPARVNTCGNAVHYTGITVCRGLDRPHDAPELSHPCDVAAASGACFAIRRELWSVLGGFDETFFTYLEDTDLSLRALLLGYRCLYVPAAVVYHSYSGRFPARKLYHLERNRAIMLLKFYQPRTLFLLMPALLLAECITWGYALKSGPHYVVAKLHAYAWIAVHYPDILRRRRELQATRRISDRRLLSALASRLEVAQLAGPALDRASSLVLSPAFTIWHRLASDYAAARKPAVGSGIP